MTQAGKCRHPSPSVASRTSVREHFASVVSNELRFQGGQPLWSIPWLPKLGCTWWFRKCFSKHAKIISIRIGFCLALFFWVAAGCESSVHFGLCPSSFDLMKLVWIYRVKRTAKNLTASSKQEQPRHLLSNGFEGSQGTWSFRGQQRCRSCTLLLDMGLGISPMPAVCLMQCMSGIKNVQMSKVFKCQMTTETNETSLVSKLQVPRCNWHRPRGLMRAMWYGGWWWVLFCTSSKVVRQCSSSRGYKLLLTTAIAKYLL